jgi:hypothetical protein
MDFEAEVAAAFVSLAGGQRGVEHTLLMLVQKVKALEQNSAQLTQSLKDMEQRASMYQQGGGAHELMAISKEVQTMRDRLDLLSSNVLGDGPPPDLGFILVGEHTSSRPSPIISARSSMDNGSNLSEVTGAISLEGGDATTSRTSTPGTTSRSSLSGGPQQGELPQNIVLDAVTSDESGHETAVTNSELSSEPEQGPTPTAKNHHEELTMEPTTDADEEPSNIAPEAECEIEEQGEAATLKRVQAARLLSAWLGQVITTRRRRHAAPVLSFESSPAGVHNQLRTKESTSSISSTSTKGCSSRAQKHWALIRHNRGYLVRKLRHLNLKTQRVSVGETVLSRLERVENFMRADSHRSARIEELWHSAQARLRFRLEARKRLSSCLNALQDPARCQQALLKTAEEVSRTLVAAAGCSKEPDVFMTAARALGADLSSALKSADWEDRRSWAPVGSVTRTALIAVRALLNDAQAKPLLSAYPVGSSWCSSGPCANAECGCDDSSTQSGNYNHWKRHSTTLNKARVMGVLSRNSIASAEGGYKHLRTAPPRHLLEPSLIEALQDAQEQLDALLSTSVLTQRLDDLEHSLETSVLPLEGRVLALEESLRACNKGEEALKVEVEQAARLARDAGRRFSRFSSTLASEVQSLVAELESRVAASQEGKSEVAMQIQEKIQSALNEGLDAPRKEVDAMQNILNEVRENLMELKLSLPSGDDLSGLSKQLSKKADKAALSGLINQLMSSITMLLEEEAHADSPALSKVKCLSCDRLFRGAGLQYVAQRIPEIMHSNADDAAPHNVSIRSTLARPSSASALRHGDRMLQSRQRRPQTATGVRHRMQPLRGELAQYQAAINAEVARRERVHKEFEASEQQRYGGMLQPSLLEEMFPVNPRMRSANVVPRNRQGRPTHVIPGLYISALDQHCGNAILRSAPS